VDAYECRSQSEGSVVQMERVRKQRKSSWRDWLLTIFATVALIHSVFFTHFLRVDSLYNAVAVTSANNVPVASSLQASPNCIVTGIPKCEVTKQLEFLVPTEELSIHRSLLHNKDGATNLFIDVDALCPCVVSNRRRKVALGSIKLPLVKLLKVRNARNCGMSFLSFNVSLPGLKRLIFNNGDLRGDRYGALETFLEPSMSTLRIVLIDDSRIDRASVDKLKQRATNLQHFTVNKEIIVPSEEMSK